MLVLVRWIVVVALFCSGGVFAQDKPKVVVVPLFGDGSSHEHPEMEYVSLSAAAFQPTTSGAFDGLVRGSDDSFSYDAFYANLLVPNGVTFQSLRATYIDGDAAQDVRVSLMIGNYSENTMINIAGFSSTGLSFGSPFSNRSQVGILPLDGKHPVNNQSNGYSIHVFLRNGAALRGVTIGYTTGID